MRPTPRLLLATTAFAFVALVPTTTPRAQQIAHNYQAEPHAPFPALPNRDALEIQ